MIQLEAFTNLQTWYTVEEIDYKFYSNDKGCVSFDGYVTNQFSFDHKNNLQFDDYIGYADYRRCQTVIRSLRKAV